MKAIITRPNEDGTYDEVGMGNRHLTKPYKTLKNLIKWNIPDHYKGKIRFEIWYGDNIYKDPDKVIFVDR